MRLMVEFQILGAWGVEERAMATSQPPQISPSMPLHVVGSADNTSLYFWLHFIRLKLEIPTYLQTFAYCCLHSGHTGLILSLPITPRVLISEHLQTWPSLLEPSPGPRPLANCLDSFSSIDCHFWSSIFCKVSLRDLVSFPAL